jgi:lysozyme
MNEIRKLDAAGRAFIKQEEGLILHPYRDIKGIPTIGLGCTYYPDGKRVTMLDKPLKSETEAWALFDAVNPVYALTVYSTTRDDITQNMFNALFSLCYNIGTGANGFKGSTVLELVNKNPNDPAISAAFYMWRFTTIDGVKKPKLAARRKREADLYFKK